MGSWRAGGAGALDGDRRIGCVTTGREGGGVTLIGQHLNAYVQALSL